MISLKALWDAFQKHTHTLASLGAAAANHTHSLASLGAAAADHTHEEFTNSNQSVWAQRTHPSTFASGETKLITSSIGSFRAMSTPRPVKVSLPPIFATSGRGTTPGYHVYITVNGTEYLAERCLIMNDKYGNGLETHIKATHICYLPQYATDAEIKVRVVLQNMSGLAFLDGFVVLELLDNS